MWFGWRIGRVAALASLAVLALAPLAARADGLDFTVPDDYTAIDPPRFLAGRALLYREWRRAIGAEEHAVRAVVRSVPTPLDALDALVAQVGAGAAPGARSAFGGCGPGGIRTSFVAAVGGVSQAVENVTAVDRGRYVSVTYTRPAAARADPEATASLDTVCSGIHQAFDPDGWTYTGEGWSANLTVWTSADRRSELLLYAVAQTPDDAARDLASVVFAGRVAYDAREPCGAITVRRVVSSDDAMTYELVLGYRRGVRYGASYRRPKASPRDPAAGPALISFCG